MSSSDIAIKVENVSKDFVLPHLKANSVKSLFTGFYKSGSKSEKQHVLKNVSFEVEKGDFFGIVGRNGSGKSTLLKLIAGIYQPTNGNIHIHGKLMPFIELGVGFNPELTGRENIYLSGALSGFSESDIDNMYEDIVEFAELQNFMDQKLKNYSSGMQVRLAFSIAIRANTDILVLDEVLAVGDEAFQRKCDFFFEEIRKDKNKTVILVTHSMESVRKYCNKALLLRNGKVAVYGSPEDVSNQYSLDNIKHSTTGSIKEVTNKNSAINDLKVELLSKNQINEHEKLEVKVSYSVPTNIPTRIKISVMDIGRNSPLFAADSPVINTNKVSVVFSINLSHVNDTDMKMSVSIRAENFEILDFLRDESSPIVALRRKDYPNTARKTTWGLLFDRGEWRI